MWKGLKNPLCYLTCMRYLLKFFSKNMFSPWICTDAWLNLLNFDKNFGFQLGLQFNLIEMYLNSHQAIPSPTKFLS